MSSLSVRRVLPALALLCATIAAPRALAAQNVIEQQSTRLVELMATNGLSKKAERDGALHQTEAIEVVMEVQAARDVVIAAICDQDCSDLDLRVSKDGTMLGEDILDDDAPMVRLQSFGGGTLRVRVEMPACSVAPCSFRVMVFAR